jgi:hypothetical protein
MEKSGQEVVIKWSEQIEGGQKIADNGQKVIKNRQKPPRNS